MLSYSDSMGRSLPEALDWTGGLVRRDIRAPLSLVRHREGGTWKPERLLSPGSEHACTWIVGTPVPEAVRNIAPGSGRQSAVFAAGTHRC